MTLNIDPMTQVSDTCISNLTSIQQIEKGTIKDIALTTLVQQTKRYSDQLTGSKQYDPLFKGVGSIKESETEIKVKRYESR